MNKRGRRISTLGSRLTSLTGVGLVLLLLGLAATGAVACRHMEAEVRTSAGLVLLMSPDSDARQTNGVKSCLMALKGVSNFIYTDADEILRSESEAMGRDIAAEIDGNPYRSEFDVRVRPQYASSDSIAAMAEFLSSLPGVDSIETESEIINDIDSAIQQTATILGAAGLILMVISIALIANTVSLSVYGRRFIIHTMKLVGATAGYIRAPFVRVGAWGGFLAGAAASAVLLTARYYLPKHYPLVQSLVSWEQLAYICGGMCLLGTVMTALTSLIAANRYIRASYDQMFLI